MINVFFWRKSLFQKLVLSFCITILLPVLIIGGISYSRASRQIEMQTEGMLRQINNDVARQMEMVFREYEWMSLQIIQSGDVSDFLNLEEDDYYGKMLFTQWMAKNAMQGFSLKKQYIEGITIFGNNGQVYTGAGLQMNFSTGRLTEMMEGLRDLLPFDGSLQIFTRTIAAGQEGNSQSDPFLITLGRRIYRAEDAREKGAFFLSIRAEEISDIWRDIGLKGGLAWFVWIVDEGGKVIYHPEDTQFDKPLESLIGRSLPSDRDGMFRAEYNGEGHLFVYDTVSYGGWKVLSGMRWSDIQEPIGNLRNLVLFTSIFSFPLFVILGYIFIRSILNPLRKLQRKMKEVGGGNWTVYEGRIPPDEIGELMSGFNSMVCRISDLIEQVYKSEIDRKKEELERNRLELEWKKAELNALQTQINPHFLYNALNTVNAYAVTNEKHVIEEMVKALGNLFRYAVRNPMEPVSVKEEIDNTRNYILIMKCRYGKIPEIRWDVDGYLGYSMLRLTLQPLLENTFKYAFPQGIEDHHVIRISAKEENGVFFIEVADNGVGPNIDVDNIRYLPESIGSKGGIGLANVHRRLMLAYGESYGLYITGKRGAGMKVSMHMPLSAEIS